MEFAFILNLSFESGTIGKHKMVSGHRVLGEKV